MNIADWWDRTFQGIRLCNRQICNNVTVSFEHLTSILQVQKTELSLWRLWHDFFFLSVMSDTLNLSLKSVIMKSWRRSLKSPDIRGVLDNQNSSVLRSLHMVPWGARAKSECLGLVSGSSLDSSRYQCRSRVSAGLARVIKTLPATREAWTVFPAASTGPGTVPVICGLSGNGRAEESPALSVSLPLK